MRLWTLHPLYLDRQGLTALWREALLAQAVLLGKTRGYRHHPQLTRFRAEEDPPGAIAAYLTAVHEEAGRRGYQFDERRIGAACSGGKIVETTGQLDHEWRHLKAKLSRRSPEILAQFAEIDRPRSHPSFKLVNGGVRDWERA